MVQGTVLAIQGVVLHTVVLYTVLVLYREVLARDRGEYWLCTGGVGVTGGERIAGEVICEVAVGKKYKSRKTYNCEVVER